MGPRALAASSGLAPWSMAVDRTSPSRIRKFDCVGQVKGTWICYPADEYAEDPVIFNPRRRNALHMMRRVS